MNDCLAKDGEAFTKKQKVKFEGESESEIGADDDGSKGWLLGDYKVGDINFAIASVTKERQVKKRKTKNMNCFKYCKICLMVTKLLCYFKSDIEGRFPEKKLLFFWICPNYLPPPAPYPQFYNLYNFFRRQHQ